MMSRLQGYDRDDEQGHDHDDGHGDDYEKVYLLDLLVRHLTLALLLPLLAIIVQFATLMSIWSFYNFNIKSITLYNFIRYYIHQSQAKIQDTFSKPRCSLPATSSYGEPLPSGLWTVVDAEAPNSSKR